MRLSPTACLLFMMTACGDKDADSGAPEGDCPAMGVRGQVVDEVGTLGPAASARVRAWAAGELDGPPIEGLADAEGRYALDLGAGRWVLRAEGTNGCFTDADVRVELGPCGADGVELVLAVCIGR